MNPSPRLTATVAAALAAVLLSACGSGSSTATSSATSSSGPIAVVASTDVWGDVAHVIGGDAVDVTSIISDPDQDPHSYEASTSTALAIKKAQLIIENGGGYDDFVTRMRASTKSKAPVLDAVRISGKQPVDGDLNEHVWYDFPTVDAVATKIASQLSALDPSRKATFQANLSSFTTKVSALQDEEKAIKASDAGDGIGITEPVPLYMTAASGLVNKTPAAFSEAVEEGSDVSASVLAATLKLYQDHEVKALVYNQQTTGAVTEKVKAAARAADVAIVPVTETLPKGDTYLTWMKANLDAIKAALAKG